MAQVHALVLAIEAVWHLGAKRGRVPIRLMAAVPSGNTRQIIISFICACRARPSRQIAPATPIATFARTISPPTERRPHPCFCRLTAPAEYFDHTAKVLTIWLK